MPIQLHAAQPLIITLIISTGGLICVILQMSVAVWEFR